MFLGQEVPDLLGDHRRAALPTAHIDGKAQFAFLVALHVQADVMHLNCRAIALGAGDRNLELSRQVRKFRMH